MKTIGRLLLWVLFNVVPPVAAATTTVLLTAAAIASSATPAVPSEVDQDRAWAIASAVLGAATLVAKAIVDAVSRRRSRRARMQAIADLNNLLAPALNATTELVLIDAPQQQRVALLESICNSAAGALHVVLKDLKGIRVCVYRVSPG